MDLTIETLDQIDAPLSNGEGIAIVVGSIGVGILVGIGIGILT